MEKRRFSAEEKLEIIEHVELTRRRSKWGALEDPESPWIGEIDLVRMEGASEERGTGGQEAVLGESGCTAS